MYQEIAVKNISIHHRRNGVDQQKKYRSQLMMPISTEWETVYPKNIVSTLVRFTETDLLLLLQFYQDSVFFSKTTSIWKKQMSFLARLLFPPYGLHRTISGKVRANVFASIECIGLDNG